MFFHRSNRIKTEPKIPGRLDQDFTHNKHKLKIKNIRFSIDQDIDKASKQHEKAQLIAPKSAENQQDPVLHLKKLNFLERLPQITFEGREPRKEPTREKQDQLKDRKQLSMQQYKKKDALLNSILQILKPNSTSQIDPKEEEKRHRFGREWKKNFAQKEYMNEFFQELPQHNTTKHQRAPKILQHDIFKFKQSNTIVRRKIYSEDKERQKNEAKSYEVKSPPSDLEKIQIMTFANKFPPYKREQEEK